MKSCFLGPDLMLPFLYIRYKMQSSFPYITTCVQGLWPWSSWNCEENTREGNLFSPGPPSLYYQMVVLCSWIFSTNPHPSYAMLSIGPNSLMGSHIWNSLYNPFLSFPSFQGFQRLQVEEWLLASLFLLKPCSKAKV